MLTLTGGITAGGARNLIVRGDPGDFTISGAIASLTRDLTYLGSGTLTLANEGNTFTGYLIVASGIVDINSIADIGIACAAGQGSLIKLGTPGGGVGCLRFSSDKTFQIDGNSATAGGRIENSVARQTLTLSGAVTQGGTQSRLQLLGVGDGVLSGAVSGRLHIEKSGSGTWTLSNAENTYTGNTTVSEGRLVVGAAGAVSNSPLIAVAAGATCDVSTVTGFTVGAAQTLAGSGTVKGDAVLAGTLIVGGAGEIGTLSADNFTFAEGCKVFVDGADTVADLLDLSGAVVVEKDVAVTLNHSGDLPTRLMLVHAPLGITGAENLKSWSFTGAFPTSRTIWDAETKTITLMNLRGTIISIK